MVMLSRSFLMSLLSLKTIEIANIKTCIYYVKANELVFHPVHSDLGLSGSRP